MIGRLASLARGLGARLRAWRRDERGSSTVEFVIVFPVVITLFCSGAEQGLLMMRQVLLDRSVDIVIRDQRINNSFAVPSQDTIRSAVCNAMGLVGCSSGLLVELTQTNKGASLPSATATCNDTASDARRDRADEDQMIVIRACLLYTPIFPGVGLGMQLAGTRTAGQYALVSTAVYVVEPKGST